MSNNFEGTSTNIILKMFSVVTGKIIKQPVQQYILKSQLYSQKQCSVNFKNYHEEEKLLMWNKKLGFEWQL